MGNVTLLTADGLLATAAVMVTVFPMGMSEGAVNMEATPSGVWVGTNVPQAPPVMLPVTGLPPQTTVQFTPELALSPMGVMFTWTTAPAGREESWPAPLGSVTETTPAFMLEPLEQPEKRKVAARAINKNHRPGTTVPFGLPSPAPRGTT